MSNEKYYICAKAQNKLNLQLGKIVCISDYAYKKKKIMKEVYCYNVYDLYDKYNPIGYYEINDKKLKEEFINICKLKKIFIYQKKRKKIFFKTNKKYVFKKIPIYIKNIYREDEIFLKVLTNVYLYIYLIKDHNFLSDYFEVLNYLIENLNYFYFVAQNDYSEKSKVDFEKSLYKCSKAIKEIYKQYNLLQNKNNTNISNQFLIEDYHIFLNDFIYKIQNVNNDILNINKEGNVK